MYMYKNVCMYVCICSSITESEISRLIHEDGVSTIEDIQKYEICVKCKSCEECIKSILNVYENQNVNENNYEKVGVLI